MGVMMSTEQDLSPGLPRLSTNDHLRSASTFHSLYAISSQVSCGGGGAANLRTGRVAGCKLAFVVGLPRQLAPVVSSGIETLDTETFTLQCFQTPTGA